MVSTTTKITRNTEIMSIPFEESLQVSGRYPRGLRRSSRKSDSTPRNFPRSAPGVSNMQFRKKESSLSTLPEFSQNNPLIHYRMLKSGSEKVRFISSEFNLKCCEFQRNSD